MLPRLLEILACPADGHSPLDLVVFETSRSGRLSFLAGGDEEIEQGALRCRACDRVFPIEEGIPRLVTEGFANAEATGRFFAEHSARLDGAGFGGSVEKMSARLASSERSAAEKWAQEEMGFWEAKTYSADLARDRFVRKPGIAGDRLYPRHKHIFRRLDGLRRGARVVEIGCGRAETVANGLPPERHGLEYIGTDLAFSGLRLSRRHVAGQFVQASATELPFLPSVADVLLVFGCLHHLPGHENNLIRLSTLVRPGGYIGLHESVERPSLLSRVGLFARLGGEMSEHEEHVDRDAIMKILRASGEIVHLVHEQSALRTWLMVSGVGRIVEYSELASAVVDLLDRAVVSVADRLGPNPFSAGSVMALVRVRPPVGGADASVVSTTSAG